VSGRKEN